MLSLNDDYELAHLVIDGEWCQAPTTLSILLTSLR